MGLKQIFKDAVEGTGEAAEALMSAASGVVKEGTHDISEVFKAVIELGKEGAVDVTVGVKSVFIASVKALKETGKSTEDAVSEVTAGAEKAVGEVSKEGLEAVGGAAKKGIEEAKKVVKAPFEK